MQTGYVVTCPKCGKQIVEFSLADEWFCECGERGEVQYYVEIEDEEEQP